MCKVILNKFVSIRKWKAIGISSGEDVPEGPHKRKKAKLDSKIKMKVIDGKCTCLRVEYVYETESKSESKKEESASASESSDSSVVKVQKVKCEKKWQKKKL